MVGEDGTSARVAELSSSGMELLGLDKQSEASSDIVDFDDFCEVWSGVSSLFFSTMHFGRST